MTKELDTFSYAFMVELVDCPKRNAFPSRKGNPEMYRFPGSYYSFDEEGKMDGCQLYVQDYQGNNRMVVNAYTDEVEQINHYYPYGALMADISTNPDEQKYKFGGKELDRQYGLDLNDFEARQQDPLIGGRFTSVDPMAGNTPQVSPYAYCEGDPINFIDPTGMNPVYDRYGMFLGLTSEGFFGRIIVYSGEEEFDSDKAKTMTADEFVDYYSQCSQYDIEGLTSDAIENIWNNILEHFDGKRIMTIQDGQLIDRTTFSFKNKGKVRYNKKKTGNANWITIYSDGIYGAAGYMKSYETTVENIACSVIAHEWYGHYKRGFGDSTYNHSLCYSLAMNCVWYENSTLDYKIFCINKYNHYIEIEGKQK